jgi:hypothetical protein
MADGAQRQLPGKPWGYAAWAEIARRIGDQALLKLSMKELERLAPDHYETRRARALAPHSFGWARAAGWIVLLSVVALGLYRDLSSARRRRRPAGPQVAFVLLLAAGLLLAPPDAAIAAPPAPPPPAAQPPELMGPPSAERLSDIPIDKRNPESSIPTPEQANANPVQFGYWLMDMATQAEEAEKKKDWRSAIGFYRALARAVPEKSVSFAKICRAYEELGERENGLSTCRLALGKEGAGADDYSRYVRLLLSHPGPVTSAERDEVSEIVKHMRQDPAAGLGALDVQCQLAVRTGDVPTLQECVSALIAAAPQDPRTVSYHWALAVAKRDFPEAARLVQRARTAGVTDDGIAQMEDLLQRWQARRRWPLWGGVIVAVAALVFLLFRLYPRPRMVRKPA